jgi:hypothetical protein
MRPEFRADLRAQLVAITPRIVAESGGTARPVATTATPARSRPTPQGRGASVPVRARHSDSALDRLRRVHLGRPLTIAASVLVAFALLLGGAVLLSRKALPGDALYGLKRASERLELATAGSDTEKAQDYLDFATTRAKEVQSLVGRVGHALGGVHAGAAASGDTGSLIVSTLQSADSDVRSAARLLGNQAVRRHSAEPLTRMSDWAPGQEQRLQRIAAALSDPKLRLAALSSAHLVQQAQARAAALTAVIGCSCLSTANADALGPKPCTACGTSAPGRSGGSPSARPTRGGGTGTAGPTKHGKPRGGSGGGAAVTGAGNGGGNGGGGGAPAGGGSSSGVPAPSGLPTLPTTPPIGVPPLLPSSPSLPVTASSCGASVSLPLLGGIGVGLCSGVNVQVGK